MSPAQKIPRQAEHGTGGIPDTGLREQCEAMAESHGSIARSGVFQRRSSAECRPPTGETLRSYKASGRATFS